MKHPVLCLLLLLTSGAFTVAEEKGPFADSSKFSERYMVTLSEYRFKDGIAVDATEAEILGHIEKSKSEPLETIRLSTIREVESTVQFGKRVTVTVGTVTARDRTTRQTQQMQIGTLLRLTIAPDDNDAVAKITFESSRLQGEGTDHSPPDIATTSVTTTQVFEDGKPRLIGSTSAGETSYVLVTVAKLP